MADPDPRFLRVAGGVALVDSLTGLAWEPAPAAAPARCPDALASSSADGWRLPTVSELMGLLSNLPAGHPLAAPRPVVWKTSRAASRAVVKG